MRIIHSLPFLHANGTKTVKCVIFILYILSLALYSCARQEIKKVSPIGITESTPIYSESCIPPIDEFVYSNKPDQSKPTPGNDLVVPPLSPWKLDTPLPKGRELGNYIQLIRNINGYTEIWLEGPTETISGETKYEFLIYRTDIEKWKIISAEIENSGVSVGRLFIAKDSSLWGQTGSSTFDIWHLKDKSALSKYNEENQRFEFVNTAQAILADKNEKTSFPYWSILLQDTNGIFWILVHKDAIYSFDPVSHQTKRHVDIPESLILEAEISPSGDIYYIEDWHKLAYPISSVTEMPLYKFSPQTGKTERVHIDLEPWPLFSNIKFDRNGRLWLDGIGFREPNGEWYELQRSPVFVTNKIESSVDNRWKPPLILMESSDGRIWFRSSNGTVWLDLEQRKWCWFTTYQSNIVEDSDHNLWMIADGKLYKLPLGEK